MKNDLTWEDKMLVPPDEEDPKPTFHDVDRKRVIDLLQQLANHFNGKIALDSESSDKQVDREIDMLYEQLDELDSAINRFHDEPMSKEDKRWYDEDDQWQIEEGLVTA